MFFEFSENFASVALLLKMRPRWVLICGFQKGFEIRTKKRKRRSSEFMLSHLSYDSQWFLSSEGDFVKLLGQKVAEELQKPILF